MEEIYWFGYTLAFILEIISIIIAFSQKYSIRAKNFSKIGLHYSLTQGNFIEGNKPGFFSNFFGIIFRLLINPFFSWIMVFIRGYGFITLINQKISTPEKLKEIQYKLGASLLNEEEVKELIRESANFMGKDIVFENEEDDDNTLILEDDEDGWYAEISLNKKNKKAYLYSHSPDYDSVFNDIYEYKIEGDILYMKLLEKKIENRGKIEYEVKDGVILKSEIQKKYNDGKLSPIIGTYDEKIEKLEKEINWNINHNYKIKYYILSKHPEIIPQNEFKKIIRKELERVKLGFMKILDFCKDYDVEVIYNEEWKNYDFNNKNDNFDYKKFWVDLENFLENINCKKWEIEQYNEIIETLSSYLGEQKND